MEIGALLIIMTLTIYTSYLLNLLFPKKRKDIIDTNVKIDKLRKIPVKSIEQQKQFINLRYTKKKFSFTWFNVSYFVLYVFILFILFRVYNKLLQFVPWDITWRQGLLFLIFFPMLVNYILSKFGLQKKGIKIF